MTNVSRARVIASMALAGFLAAALAGFISPICLLIGVFAKFVLTAAAFGAVLGLGVNHALKTDDQTVIHISAAGFAAGGLIAWLFRSRDGSFTAMTLAIMALIGVAALSYVIKLPRERAVAVTAAATILFPIAIVMMQRVRPPSVTGSLLFVTMMMPLLNFIPLLPFAMFGGILGAMMKWDPEPTGASVRSSRTAASD